MDLLFLVGAFRSRPIACRARRDRGHQFDAYRRDSLTLRASQLSVNNTDIGPIMKTSFLLSLIVAQFALSVLAQPEPTDADEPIDVIIQQDVAYARKAGWALTMDVIQPLENPNGAAVVLIISHGWESRYFEPELLYRSSKSRNGPHAQLVEKGYTLFLPRQSSPPDYTLPYTVKDLRDAVRFIKKESKRFQIDETRVGAFGHSSGGHLALLLATTGGAELTPDFDPDLDVRNGPTVAAVVAWSGISDLTKLDPELRDLPAVSKLQESALSQYSPINAVSANDAPTLLVHGVDDESIPLSQSERFQESMKKSQVDCELVRLEGCGHAIIGQNYHIAIEETVAWFDHLLLQDSDPAAAPF